MPIKFPLAFFNHNKLHIRRVYVLLIHCCSTGTSFRMTVPVTPLCEQLTTYLTVVILLASMCYLVIFQMTALCEGFPTHVTGVWFLPGVCAYVKSKNRLS